MKTPSTMSQVLGIFLFTSLLLSSVSEARELRRHSRTSESSIASREPSTEAGGSGSGDQGWGLGFSTINPAFTGSGSITAIFDLDHLNTLQFLASIPNTNPFDLGLGILFKHTIVEGRDSGFHLGGAFGFADINSRGATTYLTSIGFIVGFHFELLSRVMVHLDGGPTLYMQTSGNTSSTSFTLSPLTPALGLSVAYRL